MFHQNFPREKNRQMNYLLTLFSLYPLDGLGYRLGKVETEFVLQEKWSLLCFRHENIDENERQGSVLSSMKRQIGYWNKKIQWFSNFPLTPPPSIMKLSCPKCYEMMLRVWNTETFFFFLIYSWLRWVFVAAHRLSLVAVSRGYSSLRCAGFSLRCLLLLRSTGSRAHRLQ